jgi:outer membrane immunogenic protein
MMACLLQSHTRSLFRNLLSATALAGGFVLFLAGADKASAADAIANPPLPPVASEVVPAFTWSGPYIGVHGGYGWGDGNASAAGASASDNFDGGRIGGFAGYNWQMSSGFVAGIEGDVNYDWNRNSYPGGIDIDSGFSGSVRARAGFAFDRALFYAAGGWTATTISIDGAGLNDDDMLNGWTIGAGLDYAFTDTFFGRVEYRYNDFGHGSLDGVRTDFNQSVVNIGLGVKF